MRVPAVRSVIFLCALLLSSSVYAEDSAVSGSTSAATAVPSDTAKPDDPASSADPSKTGGDGKTDKKSAEDDKVIVTIKSARKTGNKKSELDGSDIIVFEGGVVVSVQKGTTTSVISADKVNYNRSNDMLYASGSVKLEKTDSNTGSETATANSLLFNTSTLEGIFDNGRIIQTQTDSLNLPSGSTLIVASDVFGRDNSSTISFKNGALTFCDADPPHWRIKATRIWLLPGGEFAFFNALLYVGNVPLLYLPAFWYPKDELVFNPVFGYRTRYGYFVQTTTYIFGRKPLSAYDVGDQYNSSTTSSTTTDTTTTDSTEDNYYSFIKPSKLKDQERQGLMLHNLDTDYTGDTTNYAKIMTDWYSNLGYMFGVDSVVKPSDGYITDIEVNGQIAFSNLVFQDGSTYLPYSSTGKSYAVTSNFLGYELPYRYSANIKFSVSKPFTLSLSMPLYSDPLFTDDFGKRTETMDWIDYLMSNPQTDATSTTTTDTTVSEISSFTWSLTGSYTQSLPDAIQPYISTLSISSFSSSMIFTSKTNENYSMTDDWYTSTSQTHDPNKKFYYPSQINPIQITGKVAGTLFSYNSSSSSSKKKTDKAPTYEVPLSPPAEIAVPVDEKKTDTDTKTGDVPDSQPAADGKTVSENSKPASEPEQLLPDSALPDLAFSPEAGKAINGIDYALTYSITPSYSTEFTYSSTGIAEPEDFDWNRLKSTMYTVKIPTNVTSKLGYRDTFFGVSDAFDFSPVVQRHPYLSSDTTYGGYTDSGIASIKKTDYQAQKLDLTNTNTVSFKPFCYTDHFKDTGLAWNTTIKMVRTEFIGDEDNPQWEYLTTDVTDSDCMTVHTLDMTLAATEFDDTVGQSLLLSTKLPPQVDEYYGTLKLTFPYTTLTFETGIKQTSADDSTWVKEPFKQAATVKLTSTPLSFTESYTYELEDDYQDSLKLALTWADLQLAYTQKYTYGYDFDTTKGWVAKSSKEFLPYTASIAYASSTRKYRQWKNRISWAPSLSTSLVYDWLRPTNSYFKFIPAITLQINKFLDLTFAAETRNDNIYRYYQALDGHPGRIPGETNMFTDLMNSFRFDDESKRKASGFKLQSFYIKITHELCDWDLTASFKVTPRYVAASSDNNYKAYYDFSPYFTIGVVWRPMSGMKTKVVDKYGDWELNP